MSKIFISYRRSDSSDVTGRIFDRLSENFGAGNVFKDVDSIPFGVDFREVIQDAVSKCDVLIAIIGDDWLSETDENGNRRIDNKEDYVNIEISSALSRGIPVIPALVEGATTPAANDLPDNLSSLAFRNAAKIRPDPDFHNDIERLCDEINKHGVSRGNKGKLLKWLAILSLSILVMAGIFLTAKFFLVNKEEQVNYNEEKSELGAVYFLGIGINDYKWGDLKYAHTDIINISHAFRANNSGREYNSTLLINSEATKERIKSEIGRLRNSLSYSDIGVIAFAGMESYDKNRNFFLLPHDSSDDFKGGLSAKDIFGVLPNARGLIIFILDTCHSGAMGQAISKVNPSIITLASSRDDQLCYESSKLKAGIFSTAVISALNGKADSDKDGSVNLSELASYVEKEAVRLAAQEGHNQTPQVIGDVSQLRRVNVTYNTPQR